MTRSLLPLLLLLAFAPWLALAQATPPAAEEARGSMDFKDAEITDVIEAVARMTGRNFLYDDRVRGRVTVIAPDPVTPDEAYRVFESILQVKGFTTIATPGGILKIVPIREAKESPIDTLSAGAKLPNRDLFVTRLLPLRYVKAEAISNTLKPLVSKEASVIAYAPTNTLIITDTASNIRRLVTIIDEIDVSTYSEQIKVIPIEYADATQLAGQLQQIFTDSSSGSQPTGRNARARSRANRARAAQDAAANVDTVVGTVGEPRFITDERTNSIIVIAARQAIEKIENVVVLLDYQRKGTGRIHVYRLQNADAEEMAGTLSSLASGGGGRPTGARPGGPGGAAAAAAAAAIADLGDGVRITADAPTNSLIIQASSEGYNTISEVIEALDIRRPQVMVEALIMEVDVTDGEDLGGSLLFRGAFSRDSNDGASVTLGQGTGGSTTGAPLDSGDIGTQFTAALLGSTIRVFDPTANGGAGGFSQLPVIEGLLTASRSDSDTNIISAPVILTADNEEAEIVVGQNIPVPTSRLSRDTGGTTDDFTTSQNIARQDVGVTLRVTPQISEGDTVRLNIFQEISELAEENNELGPTTTNRTVENTVYVRDGEAVMIGGILSETETETETKVPWLGDIPILGWAFKTVGTSVRKVNLLVVLTPHIVRDPDSLQRLTVERRERFRDAASEQMDYDEDELEARRTALEAGVDLPIDTNPVRRALNQHTSVYPTQELPALQAAHEERERARLAEIEAMKAEEAAGSYVVQVAFYADSDAAVKELTNLLGEGYEGTLLSLTERGEPVHYLQIGPYVSEMRAQAVARELRANQDLPAIVVLRP